MVATPVLAQSITPVPGDPLTGSGNVARNVLTYDDLMSGASNGPVDDSAFGLPDYAAQPDIAFSGRLRLLNVATAGGYQTLKDLFLLDSDARWKHLPPFDFAFVQNGSHLIPVRQGLIFTGHVHWNLIVGPGRAWKENGDHGYIRAAFPFALVERNANATHNGVMMFLFNRVRVSQVRYQITRETCYYHKFNMWGQVQAVYLPGKVAAEATIENSHAAEVANRLPTKPITALTTDYPTAGVDLSAFGSGITPTDMTAYGFFINGTNYVSDCNTRTGKYPFPENMRLPSYSTAKSSFAAIALMRLAQMYGTDVIDALIKDYVPETSSSAGDWSAVTFRNALDMATGNYQDAGFEVDEDSLETATRFQGPEAYVAKIQGALRYAHRATPGTFWNYHTSDTFLVTQAMNQFLQKQTGHPNADIFALVRGEVFKPLHLSAGGLTTLRTDNSATGRPLGGYGLWVTRDDIAKLSRLLNNDRGIIDGAQVLQPELLIAAFQQNPEDRGLDTTSTTPFKYHYGFWAYEFTPAYFPQYPKPFWVPFMSGYGGITVALMPNGSTYYYYSDNMEFVWFPAVNESNKISPQTH